MESFVFFSAPRFISTSRISLSPVRTSAFQSQPSISTPFKHQPINGLRSYSSSSTNFFGSDARLSLFQPKSFSPLRKPNNIQSQIKISSISESKKPISVSRGGAKLVPLLISVSVGLFVRFFVPKPVEVSTQAWQLLAIFLSTNVGLVLNPLRVGAWAFIGITTTIATKTLSFSDAFQGYRNEVIWLIVISFFFARGFVKTGLGDRIATYFVKWFGKSALGLSYGLTIGETFVAPAMPSIIARAGGVFLPIIKSSLSLSVGSKPSDQSIKKLGSYLMQSQLQSAGSSSALFLTAAANNLLCLKLAEELGVKISSPWLSWFKAASLPAIVSLIITPYVLYKIFPPETKDTLDVPAIASRKLEQMGPITKDEWVMIVTMLLAVSLWVFGEAIGISSVLVAMLGLSVLLLLGVVDWDDCLNEKSAWDTLGWFAIVVGMAGQLTNLGIVAWMSNCVAKGLQSFSLSWPAAFVVLHTVYFFIHYIFASQAAHIGALYSSFLAMHMASGVPGVLAALTLAFNSCLFGAITPYSSAQAAAYYGAGYVDAADCFRLGIIMAIINIVIWGGVGTFWWKFLGLY